MLASMSLDYFDVLKVKLFRRVRNHLHYQTVLRCAVSKYVNVNKTDVLKEKLFGKVRNHLHYQTVLRSAVRMLIKLMS